MLKINKVYCADCLDGMKEVDSNSIRLCVTSPPYADKRDHDYGGIPAEEYVEWFLPRADQLYRVLTEDGTFILNIKEGVEDCERETYVYELVLALKKRGWVWTDEFIWHKKNCYPGKWPNRFKDGWEHIYQFNKSKKYYLNKEAVKVPVKESTKKRTAKMYKNDDKKVFRDTNSGFSFKMTNLVGKDDCYPSNVLWMPTECTNVNHSAAFPRDLPRFFIRAFSKPRDIVIDPFMGRGTTAIEAQENNRDFIGFEKVPAHVDTANHYLFSDSMTLESFIEKVKANA